MLEFQNTSIYRREKRILDDFSLKIPDGAIMGLLGSDSKAKSMILAAASGLLALAAGGLWESAAREISAMAVYAGTVGAVSWILKWILRQPQILLCTIPFFVIGSLVFCPVFIDGGRYVEGVDAVGRLFLPYYYLQFFA